MIDIVTYDAYKTSPNALYASFVKRRVSAWVTRLLSALRIWGRFKAIRVPGASA